MVGSIENRYENAGHFREVLRQALENCDTGQASESDNEYIAMIAEGRLGEIPVSERPRILSLISSDPESAMLLKSLSDKGIGSSTVSRRVGTMRKLAIGWAAAACFMVGLFVWKTIDTPVGPNHYPSTMPYTVQPDSPDYWSQLDQQRFSLSQFRSRYRDYALIASTSATFVLSVLVAALLLRKSKKNNSA